MLRLSQAASSENFSEWGMPPNQRRTGASAANPGGNMDGELNVVDFYGGWQWCFRAKDREKAEKIAWLSERIVANGSHFGYSQNNGQYPRTGVFDLLNDEPDPLDVTMLANCDCSSKAGACVYHAGVKDSRLRNMWTGSEREILLSTGEFIELRDPLLLSIGTGIRRGDILLKPGHTAICLDDDDHPDTFPVRLENCSYSRIRKGPGTGYDTLSILPRGTILEAEGTSEDDDGTIWYRVIYAGEKGYTSAAYAKPLPEGKCLADTWLRKEPGTGGEEIIVIPKGETVYFTGEEDRAFSFGVPRKWYEIIFAGHKGWASSLNIEE